MELKGDFNMKPLALFIATIIGGTLAHAGTFDDHVDAQEAANALIHCSDQAKGLLPSEDAYVGDVVGRHEKVSERVDTKTIVFKGLVGGLFGGPAAQPVAILTVIETVTQPPLSRMDASASSVYSCQLSK
jgi:hypothetical protein